MNRFSQEQIYRMRDMLVLYKPKSYRGWGGDRGITASASAMDGLTPRTDPQVGYGVGDVCDRQNSEPDYWASNNPAFQCGRYEVGGEKCSWSPCVAADTWCDTTFIDRCRYTLCEDGETCDEDVHCKSGKCTYHRCLAATAQEGDGVCTLHFSL
jgi:hypothetical protein